MIDLNRIIVGAPEHKLELLAAGVFAFLWFAMDLIQWIDWLISKLYPAVVVCTK